MWDGAGAWPGRKGPVTVLQCVWPAGRGKGICPLPRSPEAPGALRPALGSAAQERPGAVGAGPGGPSNDGGAGTALLCGKAERAGGAQPGEEKAPRRPYGALLIYKPGDEKDGERLYQGL